MNNNIVELLGWYGDDTIIACSAWTSTHWALRAELRDRTTSYDIYEDAVSIQTEFDFDKRY